MQCSKAIFESYSIPHWLHMVMNSGIIVVLYTFIKHLGTDVRVTLHYITKYHRCIGIIGNFGEQDVAQR